MNTAFIKYTVVGGLLTAVSGSLLAVDSDGDGLDDSVETNTGIYVSATDTGTNPFVADSDGDGVGDWYEVVTLDEDPSGAQTNAPNDPALFTNRPYPLGTPDAAPATASGPVKVYILSGQSNMDGYGLVSEGSSPGTLTEVIKGQGKFSNLLNSSNDWLIRNDVKVRGLIAVNGDGPLEPGPYGGTSGRIGPEFGFGQVMGDSHDGPVLIIKVSHGGRRLGWDFLPPGSPQYVDGSETYAGYGESPKSWTTGSTPVPDSSYAGYQFDQSFLDEADWAPAGAGGSSVNATDILDNFTTEYPEWAGRGFEIAGFVWWQGYSDQQSAPASYSQRYEQNMVQFIKELRKYYENRYPSQIDANAPFVLGTLATFGWNQSITAYLDVVNGQLAVDGDAGNYPEFAGNVKTIEARNFYREGEVSPRLNGQVHHYRLNAETYLLVGDAFGRAMLDFERGAASDTKAPERIALEPPNGFLEFRADEDLSITFDDTVQLGTGAIVLKNLTDSTQISIPLSDTTQVSLAGYKLTIDPTANLLPGKDYAIQIPSTAIEDLAGNSFAGITDDETWAFQVIAADVTAPPAPVITVPVGARKAYQITVEVAPVDDPEGYGVEYLFKNLTLGTDSGWSIHTSWTNTGLDLNTNYVYAVQTRDNSPSFNESSDSAQRAVATLPEVPSVKIADNFSWKQDFAPSDGQSDTGGASKPITIDTTGFEAAGSDKLVGVIMLHNSAASTSLLSSLSYGGVDVFENVFVDAVGNYATRQYIFYLDDPAADGDLVMGFEAAGNIDEVSVVLFALNDVVPGYGQAASGNGNPAPVAVLEGDFVLGVGQRNNQSQSIVNAPPYTAVNISTGHLAGYLGYLVADADMSTAPVFSNTGILSSIAVFEATVTVSGYTTWAETNAPTTGGDLSADEDGDFVKNGIEYVLGGSAATNDGDKLPTLALSETNVTFSFVRDQASIDGSTVTSVVVGSNLSSWPQVFGVGADTASSSAGVTVTDNLDGTDMIVLTIPRGSDSKKFARLSVSIQN